MLGTASSTLHTHPLPPLTTTILAQPINTHTHTHTQERGTILTAFIVCYALTSLVGGYVSGGLYARLEGSQSGWIRCMLLTASLFPGLVFGIAGCLNTIAIGYGSLAAVPAGYIAIVLLLWAFLSFPLCIVGTILGRNWNSVPNHPCRVKRIPSPIPHKAWYLSPRAIVAAGGLLPFGSIFIGRVLRACVGWGVGGQAVGWSLVALAWCGGRWRAQGRGHASTP